MEDCEDCRSCAISCDWSRHVRKKFDEYDQEVLKRYRYNELRAQNERLRAKVSELQDEITQLLKRAALCVCDVPPQT